MTNQSTFADKLERMLNRAETMRRTYLEMRMRPDDVKILIAALRAPRSAQEPAAWQPIETAPKEKWIIGYTSWGQHVGKFHEWVGPCEWCTDHFEFTNTDFDVFPLPTHWHPLPAPLSLTGEVGKCARCGFERKEHSYNGACYGICGEFTIASAHCKVEK